MGDDVDMEELAEFAVEVQTRELRRLLGLLLDRVVMPGHPLGAGDWEQACLMSGRFLPRYLNGQPKEPGDG